MYSIMARHLYDLQGDFLESVVLQGLFNKGTSPIHKPPPSWPHHLPKTPQYHRIGV